MWQIKLNLTAEPPGDSPDIREIIRASYQELCRRADIFEPELSGVLRDGCVAFVVHLEADDREMACRNGIAAIRAALHGAGAHTLDWDARIEAWIEGSEIASRPLPAREPELAPA